MVCAGAGKPHRKSGALWGMIAIGMAINIVMTRLYGQPAEAAHP